MNDLFTSQMSKKDKLLEFVKAKGYFSSHDVNNWGTNNYFDSATRRIREWCEGEKPKVRRMNDQEILRRGLHRHGNQHLMWYECIDKSL